MCSQSLEYEEKRGEAKYPQKSETDDTGSWNPFALLYSYVGIIDILKLVHYDYHFEIAIYELYKFWTVVERTQRLTVLNAYITNMLTTLWLI